MCRDGEEDRFSGAAGPSCLRTDSEAEAADRIAELREAHRILLACV